MIKQNFPTYGVKSSKFGSNSVRIDTTSPVKNYPQSDTISTKLQDMSSSNDFDKQRIFINTCKACIEYVNNDRFILNDNSFNGGLSLVLRPSMTGNQNSNLNSSVNPLANLVTDVRDLMILFSKSDESSYNRLLRKFDAQPQVILSTALQALRTMTTSLWNDIYDDILKTADAITDDYNQTKQSILSWLVLLNPSYFELSKILFKFLNRYLISRAKLPNTSSASDLAAVVASYICRPGSTAFMSIRHQSDLRRIRPIVSFIIERFSDIFTKDLKPVSKFIRDVDVEETMRESNDSGSQWNGDRKLEAKKSFKLNRKLLPSLLTDSAPLSKAPQSNFSVPVESPSFASTQDAKSLASLSINHWELRILESIVYSASMDYLNAASYQAKASSMSSPFRSLQSNKNALDYSFDLEDQEMHGSSKDLTVVSGIFSFKSAANAEKSIGAFSGLHDNTNSVFITRSLSTSSSFLENSIRFREDPVKKWAKKREPGLRKRMISECKAIRVQITQYEQEFKSKYGRDPKSSDRGNMQGIYTAYRDMKRTIRDISAIDIQRFTRSYITRMKLSNMSTFKMNGGLNKSNLSYSGNESHTGNSRAPSSDLLNRYRQLQITKKDIKRQLKRFDDDFTLANGRAPRKSDKEVMRPLYQNYHDIKAKVEELKKSIDMTDASVEDSKDEDTDDKSMDRLSPLTSWNSSESPERFHQRRISSELSVNTTKSADSIFAALSPVPGPENKDGQLAALLDEKKSLHSYLKAYERDFNRTHGRAVMKEEDIQPVANEYQRYKALKNLIRDVRDSS